MRIDCIFVRLDGWCTMKMRQITKSMAQIEYRDIETYAAERQRVLTASGVDNPSSHYSEFEMDSPFVDTHADWSFTHDTIELHSHTFFEIIYVEHSGGLQYLLGTDCYHIEDGDIIVIPPGVSHRPLTLERLTEPYRRLVIWASPRMAEVLGSMFPQLDLLPSEALVLKTDKETSSSLYIRFKQGVNISMRYDDDWWQALVVGNTIELLTQIMRVKETGALALPTPGKHTIEQVLAFIEAHYSDAISARDVAAHLNMSESSLSQLLRKQMNVSFHKLLTQRRLIAAKHLLLSGETGDRTSTRVGFGDYSSFYRAFKREYGISPSEYVKLNEEK